MQHERLFALALQRVDDLRVAAGAERRRDQRLGLAAGEQRRAVGARQHAGAHDDVAHGAGVAAVDARLRRRATRLRTMRLSSALNASFTSSADQRGSSPPASDSFTALRRSPTRV